MGNIIDYVRETSELSFKDKEFSTEDALVLSEFCYLKFDGMVGSSEDKEVSLWDIDNHPDKENLFVVKAYEKDNRALYNAIIESKRFNNMKLSNYVNRIDLASETQFAAITFSLEPDVVFVAYRGTDETMVGWQEDFALALKKPIKGQTLSARYLTMITDKFNCPLYVGGHSKGGNLAVYAALCSNRHARKLIKKIYSFDGPGYRPEFLEREKNDVLLLEGRIEKLVPKNSPIGLLLNTPFSMRTIEARSIGMLQHNPYNWIIKDGKLVDTDPSEQHLITMKTMNDFLLSLDDDEIVDFVGMLCKLLNDTEALTTEEFKEHIGEHALALIRAGRGNDEAYKEMMSNFAKSYFGLAGEIILEEVKEREEAFFSEIRQKLEETTKRFEFTKRRNSNNK